MTQNGKQWAAITYPEMPVLSPKAMARRSYVRIGVKVALITLPFVLAAVFASLSSSGPHYAGDATAQAVMTLTKTTEVVMCDDTAKATGAVSECAAKPSTGPGLETFDVTFVDNQGDFTLTWPNDHELKGNIYH